jgi:RNA polymerase sigma-70 factor (ECF subfamily)
MPDDPDAELLARWRAGEDGAGQCLCERHGQLVQRIVRAHRPRACAPDDLVQEVFLTMFARSERYAERAGTPFAHWLSRLAVHVCRDALRAEARRPSDAGISAEAADALAWLRTGAADARHDAEAARELVEILLATLPPADRLVLTLLDLEGRSVAEIAALTGWSRTLVKVRAFRARRRLRASARRHAEGAR